MACAAHCISFSRDTRIDSAVSYHAENLEGITTMNALSLQASTITSSFMSTQPLGTKAHAGADHTHDGTWSSLSDICSLLNIPNIGVDTDIQFQRRRVKAGQWLFGCGEKFDAIFIVHSGFLKTLILDEAGNEQILGFPLKGDLLGIDGLHSAHYASNAVALTDCELVVIPFRDLATLGHDHAILENWLYRAISRELVREYSVVGLLGTLGAEARVARFLVSLSERFKNLGYSPVEFNLRMTRQEIGSYLGLTLETVSRSLSALQLAGFISINQRAVSLHDVDGLRSIQKLTTAPKVSSTRLNVSTQRKTAKRDNSIWSNLAAA
jgi:CRP/FNR family transcriptional regulator, anaerobic regulatory protein